MYLLSRKHGESALSQLATLTTVYHASVLNESETLAHLQNQYHRGIKHLSIWTRPDGKKISPVVLLKLAGQGLARLDIAGWTLTGEGLNHA